MFPFSACICKNPKMVNQKLPISIKSSENMVYIENDINKKLDNLQNCSTIERHRARIAFEKRRRKQASKELYRDKYGLLDDNYFYLAEKQMHNVNAWDFNIFALENFTCGHPMLMLGFDLFEKHGIIQFYGLDRQNLAKMFSMIEEAYHSTNPYHNIVHAADVTQAMHCFLRDSKLCGLIDPFDAVCALISAMCHDADHPGVNQGFLEKTSHYLMDLYGSASALENHHWRVAISIIRGSGVFDHLPTDEWNKMKDKISKIILATDISKQNEFLEEFSMLIDNHEDLETNEGYKLLVLQMAMKCADIGNPSRSWPLCSTWATLVCDEFFRQGDREKKLGFQSSFPMDRETATTPSIQTGFIKFLVMPLFTKWHEFMQSDLSERLCQVIGENLSRWENSEQTKNKLDSQPDEKENNSDLEPLSEHCSEYELNHRSALENTSKTFHSPNRLQYLNRSPHLSEKRRSSLPNNLSKLSFLHCHDLNSSSKQSTTTRLLKTTTISPTSTVPSTNHHNQTVYCARVRDGNGRRGSLPVQYSDCSNQPIKDRFLLDTSTNNQSMLKSSSYRRGSAPTLGVTNRKSLFLLFNYQQGKSSKSGRLLFDQCISSTCGSTTCELSKSRGRSSSVDLCRHWRDSLPLIGHVV